MAAPVAPPPPSLAESFRCSVLAPEFWSCLAQRKPAHLPGAAVELPELVTLDDVVAALTVGVDSGATACSKHGDPYMRGDLFLAYLDHATLTISGAERYFRPLLEISRALSPELDYVTARLVMEPLDSKAPPLRTDADLLMIQIWGEQRLTVRKPLFAVPMSAPRPGPLLISEVRPGDVLLLPRGVDCQFSTSSLQAVVEGAPTETASASNHGPLLYALLTLRTNEQSFEACLSRYLNDVLLGGGFSADSDAFFRSAVTKHSQEDNPERLEQLLASSAADLASKVNGADFRRHITERMAKLRDEQASAAEEILVGSSAAGPLAPPGIVSSQSRVAVSEGIACRCQPGSTTACFRRGGDTLNLPIAASASGLINSLSDGKPHVVGTLPCEDPVERLCVCQILIFKGCVSIVPDENIQR